MEQLVDIVRSCYCCLRCDPEKRLTTPYTHLGNTEIYADMLKECFNLHLRLVEDGECSICEVCVGRLRDASDFKRQVQNSQAELLNRLEEALQAKEEYVDSEIEDENGISDEPMIYYWNEYALGSEVEITDEKPADILCYEPALGSEVEVTDKINDETTVEIIDDTAVDITDEKPAEITDETTEMLFVSVEEDTDISLTSGGALSDDDCASLGPSRGRASPTRSVTDRVREQLAMACSVRLERLREPRARRPCPARHREPRARQPCPAKHREPSQTRIKKTSDKYQTYTCDACGRQFHRRVRMVRHFRIHVPKTSAGTYTCDVCGKTFENRKYMVRHFRIHVPGGTYTCDVCGKTFENRRSMVSHFRIHMRADPDNFIIRIRKRRKKMPSIAISEADKAKLLVPCDICNKILANKRQLQHHKLIHNELKRSVCEFCGKRFAHTSTLANHRRQHTGERPYVCKICNKDFTRSQALLNHQRIHEKYPDKKFIIKKPPVHLYL